MTHPEHDGELLKFVNTWLVEVAFGVYDREDLPNLAHEMLEEFAAHTAKEVAAARIELLEELDRQSEVIGVGYPIVRAEYVRDRIAQLQANNKGEL